MVRVHSSSIRFALVVALLSACKSAGDNDAATQHATLRPGFEAFAVVQKEPVWCWAACAQMIHAYHGTEITQTELAERIHGQGEDGTARVEAASSYEVMCALSPEHALGPFAAVWAGLSRQLEEQLSDPMSIRGADVGVDATSAVTAVGTMNGPTKLEVIDDLRAGEPAVIGLRNVEDSDLSHLYVLCGARYVPTESASASGWLTAIKEIAGQEGSYTDEVELAGDYIPEPWEILEVDLIDPYTAEVETMSADSIRDRLTLVISRKRAREVLQSWGEIVQVEIASK